MIIGGSGSTKTNALLNMIKQEDHNDYSVTDNIYLDITIRMKQNISILLKTLKIGLAQCQKNSKALIKYSNDMQNAEFLWNIEEDNLDQECKVLIAFDMTIISDIDYKNFINNFFSDWYFCCIG